MSSTFRMKWKSDFDKQVILQNFEKRGWVRCSGEGRRPTPHSADDWNIYWANVDTVHRIFNAQTGHRLGETQ